MDSPYFVIAIIFFCMLGLIWMALHFGSRWFSHRQKGQASTAKTELEGMFIFTDANRILLINIGVLVFLPVLAWIVSRNGVIVAACMVLAFIAPRYVLRYIAQRRLRQFEAQLPDALAMITGALRAGASLPIALESVANESAPPVSQEFELLLREMKLGTDFGVALQNLERRVPLQDLAMVTAGMALAREVGANLAETLESIGRTIRAKLQMEGKIRSLTAQGKMQGLVMSGLPIFLIVILRVMEPEAMEPLFSEWYGWCTLAVIAVAVAIGYHFISKITNIDV
ncbi:type II secretion system F family protein [Oxalobacteraceae sp. CFBP 8755]|jgi:tight adherence protein B|nr:type II secretion system F family protein [Oxalobacteraceae sp. CFBP 8761]MBD8625845.1 type II secretion system F family protein [Oxalobacteraceae sp. CFBP 8753]MBD8630277.1 type II secretion system F family protein [Oxalobacteraceae sp. CFBP 8755]